MICTLLKIELSVKVVLHADFFFFLLEVFI